RPFGAFEPVRRLSRPTDERPQEPQWDQRGKSHHLTGGLSPRNQNGCDRRVRPHPPPRRSGGPPGWLHPWRTVVVAIRFRNLCAPAYVRAYAVSYFVDDNSDVGVPACQPVSPCPP